MFRMASPWLKRIVCHAAFGVLLSPVLAQDRVPPPPVPSPSPSARLNAPVLNGWWAGVEAWERAEAARQASWQQQLLLDDQLRYRLGVPLGRTPQFHDSLPMAAWSSVWPLVPPDDRESRYAYGSPAISGQTAWPSRRSVFEPWPFIPGDIYGLPVVPVPVAHPIFQHEVQTGPRRWESRPYYAVPAAPAQRHSVPMEYPAEDKNRMLPSKGPSAAEGKLEPGDSRKAEPPTPEGAPRSRGPKEY